MPPLTSLLVPHLQGTKPFRSCSTLWLTFKCMFTFSLLKISFTFSIWFLGFCSQYVFASDSFLIKGCREVFAQEFCHAYILGKGFSFSVIQKSYLAFSFNFPWTVLKKLSYFPFYFITATHKSSFYF